MADRDRASYYRPVPGSRELVTRPSAGDQALAEIENNSPAQGLAPRLPYQGEWLGGARFEAGLVIPAEIFDLLAPLQSPLEQAAYFHLFRLSYGEGRNFCRVGKAEIMRRTRVSPRRLNVVLEGLVTKGHIKPLHRDTRGTLYRVYLPSEVLGVPAETGLTLGNKSELQSPSATPAPTKKPRAASPARERPLESPLNEERFADVSGRGPAGPGVGEMADWFFEQRGLKMKPAARQLAVAVLTGLLEDGFSREEVRKALAWFIENQPGEKTLDRLPYFITAALEET